MIRVLLILIYLSAIDCQNTALLKKYFSYIPPLPKNELARRKGGVGHRTTQSQDIVTYQPCDEPENGIVVRKFAKRDFTLGSTSFNELIFEGGTFIDKTLLIKAFLEDSNRVFIINCPRRWGKSINLDMIKTFLSIPLDHENEVAEDITETDTYRLFMKKEVRDKYRRLRHLKNKFLITNYPRIIDLYLGKWPVIYLRFHPTKVPKNFIDCTLAFRYQIRQVFADHFHIVNKWVFPYFDDRHDNETKNQLASRLRKYINHAFNTENLAVEEIEKSLFFLSKLLYGFFKKKVFILIDDYHEPWRQIFHDGVLSEEDKIKFLTFYTNFMEHTFESNIYLEKGILTGTLPPPEELRLTAFRGIVECNMMTGKFMQYYCIHQWELKKIYEHLQVFKEAYSRIDRLYKGYRINNNNLTLYNIWSISAFFGEFGFGYEWVKTGKADWFFSNCLKLQPFRTRFTVLIKNKRLPVRLPRLHFTWPEYEPLIKALSQQYDLSGQSVDRLFMFLYFTGYLTLSRNIHWKSNVTTYYLRIPNGEVHQHLEEVVYKLRLALTNYKRLQIKTANRDRRIAAAKAWKKNRTKYELETGQKFQQKQIPGRSKNEGKLAVLDRKFHKPKQVEGPEQYRGNKSQSEDKKFGKQKQEGPKQYRGNHKQEQKKFETQIQREESSKQKDENFEEQLGGSKQREPEHKQEDEKFERHKQNDGPKQYRRTPKQEESKVEKQKQEEGSEKNEGNSKQENNKFEKQREDSKQKGEPKQET